MGKGRLAAQADVVGRGDSGGVGVVAWGGVGLVRFPFVILPHPHLPVNFGKQRDQGR